MVLTGFHAQKHANKNEDKFLQKKKKKKNVLWRCERNTDDQFYELQPQPSLKVQI